MADAPNCGVEEKIGHSGRDDRAGKRKLFLGQKDDFAGDLGFFEQFVGAGGFAKREPCGDDWLDFPVAQEIEKL